MNNDKAKYFPINDINIDQQFSKSIYAYKAKNAKDYIKIGETTRNVKKRIEEQLIKSPNKQYEILKIWNAKTEFKTYSDRDIHKELNNLNYEKCGEFYKISIDELKSLVSQILNGQKIFDIDAIKAGNRQNNFTLRNEQKEAINKTLNSFNKTNNNKFLWNAKMRFGKTFTSYKLIEKMNLKKILMITWKPAIMESWINDLLSHVDFHGWGYELENKKIIPKKEKPMIIFKSFQDIKGRDKKGKIKEQNRLLYSDTNKFDLVIFDEYHYGSWNENSKGEFKKIEKYNELINDESNQFIKSNYFLYLSGTPFKLLQKGEFIDDQIFTWSYTNEQKAKLQKENKENIQYQSLPKMVMMAYSPPKDLQDKFIEAEGEEFRLNEFFSVNKNNEEFKYKNDVRIFLSWITGTGDDKNINKTAPFRFELLENYLDHTFWILPSVASVYAMEKMLKLIPYFKEYKIILAADSKKRSGKNVYKQVKKVVKECSRTITLSAGMLNTGTTIKQWKGVLILDDINSPETYFQTAFRAQSPYIEEVEGQMKIMKDKCYLFDFSPQRCFRMYYEQTTKHDETKSKEEKINEVTNFLPVLSIDGTGMREVPAAEIIEYVISGTTSSLFARQWESPLLINVTNKVLESIMRNPDVIDAISKIKGFRNINKDMDLIITRTKELKVLKTKSTMSKTIKKSISDADKEIKSKRKKIQEKLIKFASRIPIFMYLTDTREESLKDLIITYEPKLFYETTGLSTKDFELLNKVGLFEKDKMNDAVWNFRRFENDSLEYLDNSQRKNEKWIGGFDSIASKEYILNKK